MVNSYQSGSSLRELGKRYGFSQDTIKSRLVSYGFTDFRSISEVIKLARLNYPQICSDETKERISRANKGRKQPPEGILKSVESREKILQDRIAIAEKDGLSKLYLSGCSLGILQRKYGFCISVLKRHLKSLGVQLRENRSQNIKAMYQGGFRETGTGENSPNWRGGKRISRDGYIAIWITEKQKYVYEHKLVWERVHNRKLPKGWVIHHLNGVRDDNRPENLEAMPRGSHANLAKPYKKKIRELEEKVSQLECLILDPSIFRSSN